MARRSQLEGRLIAILDSKIRRKTPGRVSAVIAALAAVAILAPLAALQAQNQRAQDPPAQSSPSKATVPAEPAPEDAVKAAEQQRKYDAYWLSIGGKLGAQNQEQQLKQALAAGEPMMDLPLVVEVDRFRVGPAKYFVPVSVELPGSVMELAANSVASVAQLDFIGQLQDETHTVTGVRDNIKLRVGPETAEQSGRKIQYDTGFTLAPGKYTLKLLARENVSGKMGTFESRFVIPDQSADTAELKLSSVVFGSQRVQMGATVRPADKSASANPLVVDGKKMVPSVTRVFRRDQSMYVNFDVYDALPDPSNREARNIKVNLSLLDGKGATAFEMAPLNATQLAATRPEAVPVNFEIPLKDIAPGRYTCQLNVVDEAGGKSASPQTRVVVTP
jgi:hypothetical protein